MLVTVIRNCIIIHPQLTPQTCSWMINPRGNHTKTIKLGSCSNFSATELTTISGRVPVVEQVLDGDLGAVLEHAVVHDAVPALADHVLVGEHLGRRLQLLERVPVAPPEVGHLRHRRRLAAAVRRRAAAVRRLRVRNAVLLAGGDLDGLRRRCRRASGAPGRAASSPRRRRWPGRGLPGCPWAP
jgi:hypothetical protein